MATSQRRPTGVPSTMLSQHGEYPSEKEISGRMFFCTERLEPYLTGLRGILAMESLIWIYFATFIPAVATPGAAGPAYQHGFRDAFSVPFWNGSLITNFFIILSMRTIPIRFLRNPTAATYAGTLIRRVFRMTFLLSIASILGTLIVSEIGTAYIDDFKAALPNASIATPATCYNTWAGFNSIFDLFMITTGFFTQAANTFWPSATLWVSSLIFSQGWTVYILMVILPYSRPEWHIQGLLLFGLGSFWYGSWGWYSVTGLFFANIHSNAWLTEIFDEGIRIWKEVRLPMWIVGVITTTIGLVLKYTFVALAPRYWNSMLVLHPFLDLSEYTNTTQFAAQGPYPRFDDWFVITGIFILIETLPVLQDVLSVRFLRAIGERAFALFVAQSIMFWTAGIKFWLVLRTHDGISIATANFIVLIVCLPATIVLAEIFHRMVDLPSRWLAARIFRWLMH